MSSFSKVGEINTLVGKFVKDGKTVIKEIAGNKEHYGDMAEEFSKLLPTLDGEFTVGRAIETARKSIKNRLDDVIKETIEEVSSINLNEFVDKKTGELSELLRTIHQNMDFNILEDRRERLVINKLAIQYAATRITTQLEPNDWGLSSKQYLYAMRELMSAIRTRNIQNTKDYTNVEEKFNEFNLRIQFIWKVMEKHELIEHLSKYQTMSYDVVSDDHEKDGKTVFGDMLKQIQVENLPNSEDEMKELVDYLVSIMESLERTYKNIQENINTIKEFFAKLSSKLELKNTLEPEGKNLLQLILHKLKEEAIVPYLGTRITSDEYYKLIKEYHMLAEMVVSNVMAIKNMVTNTVMTYRGHILAFEYVYEQISTVSLKAVLPNKSLQIS